MSAAGHLLKQKEMCCKDAVKIIGRIMNGKVKRLRAGTNKSNAKIAVIKIPVTSPKIQEEIGALL